MSEAEAKSLMVAGNQIIFAGITFRRIRSVQLTWNRDSHKMEKWLVLEDMRANALVVAPPDRCEPIPL